MTNEYFSIHFNILEEIGSDEKILHIDRPIYKEDIHHMVNSKLNF